MFPSRWARSLHPGALASRMPTIWPSYVSYTPATHPQGRTLLDNPRRIRMTMGLDIISVPRV